MDSLDPGARQGEPTAPGSYEQLVDWIQTQPDAKQQAQLRLAEFHARLLRLTPRIYLLKALVLVNVVVFVAMCASGAGVFSPSVDAVLRWGANYAPRTLHGEPWRLVTCAFVHFGILHLAFNMWALWSVGQIVERLVGGFGFLLVYLVSAIVGSVASLLWNPTLVSAGASGAVFGVVGALMGFLLRRRSDVPMQIAESLWASVGSFIFYNTYFAFAAKGIDVAAHFGGLAGGVVCGLIMAQPLDSETLRRRPMRNFFALAVAVALFVAAVVSPIPCPPDVLGALDRTFAVEKDVLRRYNAAIQKAAKGEMADAKFAELLMNDLLPPWRKQTEEISALRNVAGPLAKTVTKIADYMQLRQESMDLLLQAIRENDRTKVALSQAKSEAADRIVKEIGDNGGSAPRNSKRRPAAP